MPITEDPVLVMGTLKLLENLTESLDESFSNNRIELPKYEIHENNQKNEENIVYLGTYIIRNKDQT